MKFSEMWIRQWINPPVNSAELGDQLTMAGLKVTELQPVSNKFYEIIIGEIIECKTHEALQNIWITTVNIGDIKLLNIFCQKKNCKKNIRVAVAKIGVILPNGNYIKPITIQGKQSEGILCTFAELGITNITEEIIELPNDAPIGQNLFNYLNLHDNTLEINITPNRGDCLSVIGVSREIAVINQLKLKKIKTSAVIPTISDTIPIFIDVPEVCPQFFGRILKNININTPTPVWITEKLRRCNINTVNIVIDTIHYVLLELGQPIYIFDYEKLEGQLICIRFSQIGEELVLSNKNNKTLKLFPNTIVFCDKKKPLSIAGAAIPDTYSVQPTTHNIILQSAFFYPITIARQSKQYNLHDPYSFRYARGVDIKISEEALNQATNLLINNCGGQSGPIINITNHNFLPKTIKITLNRSKLDKLLGFHIPDQKISHILTQLGYKFIFINDTWTVTIPTWRFDISIEENLIAEIIRINGYNNIPKKTFYHYHSSTNQKYHHNFSDISLSRAKTLLIDKGYQEIITYSFINPKIQKLLHPKQTPLILKNPITSEMSVMRLSLWTGLITTLLYNYNRQHKQIKLFESGICFVPKNHSNKQVEQNLMISGIRSGLRFNKHWDLGIYPVDFYDIKGDVEALLNITIKMHCVKFREYTHPALQLGQSAAIYVKNICIGYIGMINPMIQMQLNIRPKILMFELSWNMMKQCTFSEVHNTISVSKFPKNYRDISVIIPEDICIDSIITACKSLSKKDKIIDIQLFDIYKGQKIPKGFKSITMQLSIQSNTHTLEETEISDIIKKCAIILQTHFNGTIR
ncbi:phenylalanine--tRNA ligase subunit beta [Candidatus Blochmannia ocreatus (nom. nud.)]|uniref:Phenylalanine--tRNA ligase beta subunit n=1 Tax=Candidatus Blochmannia ocreatus (nom. nud.) TaxID=251538 RepID=A0ABY4SV97_9ENTR|nr:phenylalanine--tRNA ligase subunit beta [Candidatus Blochmannia ocreatus]URJ24865.1 phenylalanine--tRNA ligase subunit beta [Candidatus Blochmannia ocreatus]